MTLAIVGATLIDGTGAPPRPDVTILVAGARIRQIGATSDTPVPPGTNVIRAEGRFVVPGLIDAHVHYRDYFAELLVTHGITSVVDWGGSPLEWLLAQRDGVAKGRLYGPRIYTPGEVISVPDDEGSPGEYAVRRVRELAERGVDKIDMEQNLDPEVVTAIIDEAHRHGLSVSGYPLYARHAVEAGIDAIKHAHTLGRANADPAALAELAQRIEAGAARGTVEARRGDVRPCIFTAPYDDLLALMASRGTAWIPTLVKDFKTVIDRRDEFALENLELLSNPQLGYLPVLDLLPQLTNSTRAGLRDTPCGLIDTLEGSDSEMELYRRSYSDLEDFARKLVQAGGRVLVGTAPHSYVMAGLSLHHEMSLLIDAGLTPMQVLQGATLWVAEYVGAVDDIGSVEEGKLADLVILAHNPLDDIRNARSIETVLQGGRILPTGYHSSYVNPIPRNTTQTAPSGGNPRPVVAGVSPSVVTEGTGELQIQVAGRRFALDSIVYLDGAPLKTEFVSQTELRAVVPARLLGHAGTRWLHVFSPRPRGGASDEVSLIVRYE